MPLIFDSSEQRISGTVVVIHPQNPTYPKKTTRKFPVNIARLIGRSLIIFSFVGLLLTYFPILAMETQQTVRRWWVSRQPPTSGFRSSLEVAVDITSVVPTATPTPTLEPLPAEEKRFQILIPKIGADACVLPNIDPTKKEEYAKALQKCVAHARGSGLPGESGPNRTIYLFAHSTNAPYNISRFNAIFYSLKDLEAGDEIIVWFWGKKFRYLVFEKKILPVDDISYFQPQAEEEKLVLQTCYPPGTTQKQLLIIAKPLNI